MSYVTAKRRELRNQLEELYRVYSNRKDDPTELGLKQFRDYETYGKIPENPDSYYLKLCDGKKWFSVDQDQTRKDFLTDNWWGFYTYYLDFRGERWILRHLFKWCNCVPEWIYEEDDTDVNRR